MRVPKLKPQTRAGLLVTGLCLIGLSTAVGLVAPEPQNGPWSVARSHAESAPGSEDCDAPG